jgi:hypothetical protein
MCDARPRPLEHQGAALEAPSGMQQCKMPFTAHMRLTHDRAD